MGRGRGAGPQSRAVLQQLIDTELMQDVNIDAAADAAHGGARGPLLRCTDALFRVSFTGELGFESERAERSRRGAVETILDAGKPFGICPYGTESMHVLRAEKGYIIVGQDTDAPSRRTMPG